MWGVVPEVGMVQIWEVAPGVGMVQMWGVVYRKWNGINVGSCTGSEIGKNVGSWLYRKWEWYKCEELYRKWGGYKCGELHRK